MPLCFEYMRKKFPLSSPHLPNLLGFPFYVFFIRLLQDSVAIEYRLVVLGVRLP